MLRRRCCLAVLAEPPRVLSPSFFSANYRNLGIMISELRYESSTLILYYVLCRPSGDGPRLDRWARIQSGRVNFGVFSTSRFVPSALSSDFFTTMYFSPTLLRFSLTFHLLFCTFDVLLGWILLLIIFIFGKKYPWSAFSWLIKCHLHETTLKNHRNQPETLKNHETTLKNHGNKQKTLKNMKLPWKTMETNQKPWKTMKLPLKPWKPKKNIKKPWNYLEKPWKPTKNHEKPLKPPWKTMETNQKP